MSRVDASNSPASLNASSLRDAGISKTARFSALSILRSPSFDPFWNLAVERELARAVQPDELAMLLWQNDRSVIIGRNQNAWRECRVDELEASGGHVARRLSGGGAVYHDKGNLNVSFVACAPGIDAQKASTALCAAVRSLGIDAYATGRNDICIGQAKVSGIASWAHEGTRCIHASIMVAVDAHELARWLTPSLLKLQAKGVASVRSRVANLSDLAPGITVDALAEAIEQTAAREFSVRIEPFAFERLDADGLERRRDRFASRQWRLGASRAFSHRNAMRFSWGDMEIELDVACGAVASARAFSDAMEADLAPAFAAALVGRPFSAAALEQAAIEVCASQPAWTPYVGDLRSLARAALEAEPKPEPKETESWIATTSSLSEPARAGTSAP